MRKIVLFLLPMLLIGCNGMTVWTMSGADVDAADNEFVGRLGYDDPCNPIEFGAQSHWIGTHGERQEYGAYVTLDVDIGDGAIGTPYVGYQASVAIDQQDGGVYGPIGGTKIPIADNAELATEVWYRTFQGELESDRIIGNDEWKFLAGLRIGF